MMCGWLLWLGLLAGGTASAEEPDAAAQAKADQRARQLFENGQRLYGEGLYDDAIAAWQEGYRLSHRPLFLYNMANAYERLGFLEECIDTLNRYRAFAPAAEQDALALRLTDLRARQEAVEAGHVDTGRLVVVGPETGVEWVESDFDLGTRTDGSSGVASPPRPLPVGAVVSVVGGAVAISGLAVGLQAVSARNDARGTGCVVTDTGWLCSESVKAEMGRARSLGVGADLLGLAGIGLVGVGLAVGVGGHPAVSVGLQPGRGLTLGVRL